MKINDKGQGNSIFLNTWNLIVYCHVASGCEMCCYHAILTEDKLIQRMTLEVKAIKGRRCFTNIEMDSCTCSPKANAHHMFSQIKPGHYITDNNFFCILHAGT